MNNSTTTKTYKQNQLGVSKRACVVSPLLLVPLVLPDSSVGYDSATLCLLGTPSLLQQEHLSLSEHEVYGIVVPAVHQGLWGGLL